jgi:PiT family inorganic phosphate transporter
MILAIIATGLLILLAFANGSNDISKTVATLAGTRITSIQKAILWGTVWTSAGALASLIWGAAIIKTISQSIYIDQGPLNLPQSVAIALAPSLWIMLATWRKWPVSTTHAIVGGLVGVGLVTAGLEGIAWQKTFNKIILPLLVSPLVAVMLAVFFAPVLERTALMISRIKVCLPGRPRLVLANMPGSRFSDLDTDPCLVCDADENSDSASPGIVLSVDQLHWLTSGLLSFSRGMHDTPKLIAIVLPLLLLGGSIPSQWSYMLAALAMAAGGFMIGNRVTEVLGFKVTSLSNTQGFSANLIATLLVIGASRLGVPVSTTHVAASSIMGIGLTNGIGLNRDSVRSIIFAWLITAPVSGLFSVSIYLLTR